LTTIRYQICGEKILNPTDKKIETDCGKILAALDGTPAASTLNNATTFLSSVIDIETIGRDDLRAPRFKTHLLDVLSGKKDARIYKSGVKVGGRTVK
jgi:hypothetical protein